MNSNKPVRDNNAVINNRTLVKEVHGFTRNVVLKVLEKVFAYDNNEDGKTLHFLTLWNRTYSSKTICI